MAQEIMYDNIPFSGDTTLVEQINSAATTIEVADGSVLPEAPNYATIGTDVNAETIFYGSKSGNILSGIERGVEGVPRTWTAGEMIARNFTNKDLVAIKNNINDLNENKLDKTGDGSDVIVVFSEAAQSVNIISGEKLSVVFGKIKKWFSSLKAMAFKENVSTSDLVDNSVTNAKTAKMNALTIKGNNVNAQSDAVDLTVAQVQSMLNMGDMLTSTYDQDGDGIVDDSEKLGGNLPTWYQQATNGLSAETDIADADTIPFYDASATTNKKSTWANIKVVLKTYFDALYTTALLKLTGYSKAASATAIAATDSICTAIGKLERGLDDKAVPATDFLATLAVASWVGASAPYTQTVSGLSGVTANSKLDIGLAETATDAQFTEAVAAQIRATGSGTGTVTFKAHGTKPTDALPILIRMVD